jgi:hypothetical protein
MAKSSGVVFLRLGLVVEYVYPVMGMSAKKVILASPLTCRHLDVSPLALLGTRHGMDDPEVKFRLADENAAIDIVGA